MIASRGDGLLERVLAHSRRRVERLKEQRPLAALRASPLYGRSPLGFTRVLGRSRPAMIGEIRFATPPAGLRDPGCPPSAEEAVRRAKAFAAAGLAGVSVVVERHFFAGDPSHLGAVRAALPELPLLMRDAVVDEYQLHLARAEGADAVTLLREAGEAEFGRLAAAAGALGLDPVVDEGERLRSLDGTATAELTLVEPS